MRLFYILLFLVPLVGIGQYDDPNVPVPSSGYGSDGSYTVAVEAFENPYYPGKDIQIFHPAGVSGPVPTVFYSHAYGGNNSNYISGLTNFVAKKGYAFVFVPYQTTGVTVLNRYENLLAGFRMAARDFPGIIDTTRVGFMGHSFGGGASFGNSLACFTENNWGANGRFIYASAQWYSFNITQSELTSFPSDVKLITEIYADDATNDHRMAADIFRNINIPDSEKDFLVLRGDTLNGYSYVADHNVPNTLIALNAYDYYGIYRLLDALCDYTWNGNLTAKDIALGDGSAAQITMPGGLISLQQTDEPLIYRPQSGYEYPCDSVANPRASYCDDVTSLDELLPAEFSVYPNPSAGIVTLEADQAFQVTAVMAGDGKQMRYTSKQEEYNRVQLDLSSADAGIYIVMTSRGAVRLQRLTH